MTVSNTSVTLFIPTENKSHNTYLFLPKKCTNTHRSPEIKADGEAVKNYLNFSLKLHFQIKPVTSN
jgi:hypothetical protein